MAITEPHLGCAYQTPWGDAICIGIFPSHSGGLMQFQLTMLAIANARLKNEECPTVPFSLAMSDETLVEVMCFLPDEIEL